MKGHRWNRWTRQEDALIVQLRREDQSYASIAQAVGKTGGAVHRRLKNLAAMGRATNSERTELPEPSRGARTTSTTDVS